MFRRLPDLQTTLQTAAQPAATVAVILDGQPVTARAGDTVAALLLTAGACACRRTAVSGAPRGPYCLMGVCFDCLVTIDGRPNQQACLLPVRAGMRIERQVGASKEGQAT